MDEPDWPLDPRVVWALFEPGNPEPLVVVIEDDGSPDEDCQGGAKYRMEDDGDA